MLLLLLLCNHDAPQWNKGAATRVRSSIRVWYYYYTYGKRAPGDIAASPPPECRRAGPAVLTRFLFLEGARRGREDDEA